MRELNSNTLKYAALKKQKLDEKLIHAVFAHAPTHAVLIQALSIIKRNNIQISQFVK